MQCGLEGGIITEETSRKYRDPNSGALVEEHTVKRTAPDWRASAHFLERQHRAEWGKEGISVELMGEGGGPVQISNTEVTGLSERLLSNLAALAAGKPAIAAAVAVAIAQDAQENAVEGEIVADV